MSCFSYRLLAETNWTRYYLYIYPRSKCLALSDVVKAPIKKKLPNTANFTMKGWISSDMVRWPPLSKRTIDGHVLLQLSIHITSLNKCNILLYYTKY